MASTPPRAVTPAHPLTPATPAAGSTQPPFTARSKRQRTPPTKKTSTLKTPPPSAHRAFSKSASRKANPVLPKSLSLQSWRAPAKKSTDDGIAPPSNDALLLPSVSISGRARRSDAYPAHYVPASGSDSDFAKSSDRSASPTSTIITTTDDSVSIYIQTQDDPSRLHGDLVPVSLPSQAAQKALALCADPPVASGPACVSCSSSPASLVTLSPCSHTLCSPCFTASLNIVGEKQFTCVTCSSPVADFHFTSSPSSTAACSPSSSKVITTAHARTQKSAAKISSSGVGKLTVLRLDDVPWDVTPTMLSDWGSVPVTRAHVLLSRKDGKTLSHAYIEVPESDTQNVLMDCRSKVLGSGKRARRVTMTVSSQDELMRELFPSWGGSFVEGTPSLAHVATSDIPTVMSRGLVSPNDIDDLTALVLRPNARYVKDPVLPYYALISVVSKFPIDGDSRVFWSWGMRDALFNVVYAAAMGLLTSKNEIAPSKSAEPWQGRIVTSLVGAVVNCSIFTSDQVHLMQGFTSLISSAPQPTTLPFTRPDLHIPIPPSVSIKGYHRSDVSTAPSSPMVVTPSSSTASLFNAPPAIFNKSPVSHNPAHIEVAITQPATIERWTPFDLIARDLGLEPNVVAAVCQRLATTTMSFGMDA